MSMLSSAVIAISLSYFGVHARRVHVKQETDLMAFNMSTASGFRAEGVESETNDLKIHAVTFNAGNSKFVKGSESDADDFYRTVLEGHEDSDMVILGYQEIWEEGNVMKDYIHKNFLWKEATKSKIADLKRDIVKFATPSSEVLEAREAIKKAFDDFHNELDKSTQKYMKDYGPGEEGAYFRDHISDVAALDHLGKKAAPAFADIKEKIKGERDEYDKLKETGLSKKFPELDKDSTLLREQIKVPDVSGHRETIKNWAVNSVASIQGARKHLPNLKFEQSGEKAWRDLEESVGGEVFATGPWDLLGLDQSARHKDHVMQAIKEYQWSVKRGVTNAEEAIIKETIRDWKKVTDATEQLYDDLKKLNKAHLVKQFEAGQTQARSNYVEKMQRSLANWRHSSTSGVDALLNEQVSQGNFHHLDNVAMSSFSQRFGSGQRCHSFKHFDTNLHIFVSPASKWRIEQVPWERKGVCDQKDSSSGCDIDNNVGWECGKVVNLVVFEATHSTRASEESVRICALNTHFSFASPANARVSALNAAMTVAKEAAKCQSVVFMGDFNTRMHCRASTDLPNENLPLFARPGRTGSSMRTIMDHFEDCDGGSGDRGDTKCTFGKIDNKMNRADEMIHMLHEESVNCWEKGKEGWAIEEMKYNPVHLHGFREVLDPLFLPTYKVASIQDAGDIGSGKKKGWQRCVIDPTRPAARICYANEDKKSKHNPAWTDRILMWHDPEKVRMEGLEYAPRPLPKMKFSSDHHPVVATLTVGPRDATGTQLVPLDH